MVLRPDGDPALNATALAGEALAAERSVAGVQQAGQQFGPFIDGGASLPQFSVLENAAFIPVTLDVDVVVFHMHDVPMLLPRDTPADAELRTCSIPAGTVWVRAARRVPAAMGYADLRVAVRPP